MNHENTKPTSLLRSEFISNLTELINNCNLPFFVLEDILKGVYLEIQSISNQQCFKEKEEYEKSIAQTDSSKKKH